MSRADYPDGLEERSPEWHLSKIIDFTRLKAEIGEPSPHLAIMGHFCKDVPLEEKMWRLSCYAASYCLPTAHVMWTEWPLQKAMDIAETEAWLTQHWPGIVTRTERRCVRTPRKMARCLHSCAKWITSGQYQAFKETDTPVSYYDAVWKSVTSIEFIGRYIAIRFIEGLRRYCDMPAMLYDVRSIGGWSPKKCLAYLNPQHVDKLMLESLDSDALADKLARELSDKFSDHGYPVNFYVLAAMLCEYKGAFENRHQYPGWTLDQEPLLYDKVAKYWGTSLASEPLWEARAALFPPEALGEKNGWHGTRWNLTKTLRDEGYNWSDLLFRYSPSMDLANPSRRNPEAAYTS